MRKIAVTLLFFAAGISGCGDRSESATSNVGFKADDEIVLSGQAFGCDSQARLAEGLDHYNRQELSAWAQIVNDAPSCFGGDAFVGIGWTVLQIRGAVMQLRASSTSQYQLLESVFHKRNSRIDARSTYWTLVTW